MSDLAPPAQTETIQVTGGPDGLRVAGHDENVVGILDRGPAALGSLIRFIPTAMTSGSRLAPYAVCAFALTDLLWGTGFGALEPGTRRALTQPNTAGRAFGPPFAAKTRDPRCSVGRGAGVLQAAC